MTDVKDFLAHHGVLGMHWGKHLPGVDVPKSDEHSNARKVLKKPISATSNTELQSTARRLQLEKQVADLKKNQTSIAKGQKAINAIFAIGALSTAGAVFIKSPAGALALKGGKAMVSKILAGNGKHVLTTVVTSTAKHL